METEEIVIKRIPTYFTFDLNNIYRATKHIKIIPLCTCRHMIETYPIPITPQQKPKKCCIIS